MESQKQENLKKIQPTSEDSPLNLKSIPKKEEEEEEEDNNNEIEFDEEDSESNNNSHLKNIPKDFCIKENENRTIFGELNCYKKNIKTGEFNYCISSTWQIYAFMTPMFILIFIYFIRNYYPILPKILVQIFIIFFSISIICGFYVFVSNPGIPSTKKEIIEKINEDDKDFCEKCNLWVNRDEFVLHCPQCNCCIEGIEQHSNFFGKCIGKGNYWSYNIYIFGSMLSIVFMLFVKGSSY